MSYNFNNIPTLQSSNNLSQNRPIYRPNPPPLNSLPHQTDNLPSVQRSSLYTSNLSQQQMYYNLPPQQMNNLPPVQSIHTSNSPSQQINNLPPVQSIHRPNLPSHKINNNPSINNLSINDDSGNCKKICSEDGGSTWVYSFNIKPMEDIANTNLYELSQGIDLYKSVRKYLFKNDMKLSRQDGHTVEKIFFDYCYNGNDDIIDIRKMIKETLKIPDGRDKDIEKIGEIVKNVLKNPSNIDNDVNNIKNRVRNALYLPTDLDNDNIEDMDNIREVIAKYITEIVTLLKSGFYNKYHDEVFTNMNVTDSVLKRNQELMRAFKSNAYSRNYRDTHFFKTTYPILARLFEKHLKPEY